MTLFRRRHFPFRAEHTIFGSSPGSYEEEADGPKSQNESQKT